MIDKNLESVETEDILGLVSNGLPEGRKLEYKETLPSRSDGDKVEFLADVSSFANASGGDILYGIIEMRDDEGNPTGLPESADGLPDINPDAEILRLENVVRDSIEPRIPGIRTRAIRGFPDGPVIVLRIPKSWVAPHMVTFKHHSRFYSRNSAGKYPLDVTEIRSAFALSEALPQRIRLFRDERIARIVAHETPVALQPNPKMVLHILPIAAFDPTQRLDVVPEPAEMQNLRPMYHGPHVERYNFDGLLSFSVTDDWPICPGYVQLFRSGAIESVEAYLLRERSGDKVIPSGQFEQKLVSAVAGYLTLEKGLALDPPILIMLTFLGVEGYTIETRHIYQENENLPIDRDTLLLPDILVEDYAVGAEETLRPAFDAVWQSAGWDRCRDYDRQGNWLWR